MPEADAERGHAALAHAPHQHERDPCLIGRARARRDNAAVICARDELVYRHTVIADRVDLRAQLTQVLHEVVGEGIVVVEDEHLHGQSGCRQASSIARSAALVLATDSSYSYSGRASATVPRPACMYATPSLTTTVRMWIAVSRSPA